jgi:putative holliday junction resolvase
MRAIGLDLGTKRIGVALCDSAGTLATPYEVVARTGDRAREHGRIGALVEEAGAQVVVVGLPLSLDGTTGPAARAALDEVEELRAALPVPVVTHDERLTTVTAERQLAAQGVRGPARRKVIDKVAAAVILQSWLDHRRAPDPEVSPS